MLEGRELYTLRKTSGPLAPEHVVWIATQVLDGLAVLHARGVVHRDLKSQNIYIVPTPPTASRSSSSTSGSRRSKTSSR